MREKTISYYMTYNQIMQTKFHEFDQKKKNLTNNLLKETNWRSLNHIQSINQDFVLFM